ncbi:hypothetical protein BD413DRAFT_22041 [Trametes elegans]|nr:hypothetical protein BD413DRAFT_22041 [Trametes elegans]
MFTCQDPHRGLFLKRPLCACVVGNTVNLRNMTVGRRSPHPQQPIHPRTPPVPAEQILSQKPHGAPRGPHPQPLAAVLHLGFIKAVWALKLLLHRRPAQRPRAPALPLNKQCQRADAFPGLV